MTAFLLTEINQKLEISCSLIAQIAIARRFSSNYYDKIGILFARVSNP